ncbi:hypothetical protein A7978_04775 (plasmid) [Borrelia turicatae]|nr:hypothetical protein [Borrelia turicatae]ANF34427.1 hypothetical protein A7978_04775 [Borrelia turicatae]UPA14013.1 hypothetical protein bt91E135_001177 [Borrelia turicatae 91E135]UPA15505.1 hypothetical protein btBTE5EL_001187 [Borrelia turicatae]
MVVRRLFLKLLFAFSLLVFNTCNKESEKFTVSYLSNHSGTGGFALDLTNSYGNLLVISYNSYLGGSVRIYLELKSDREMRLKSVKLNESDVCFYDLSVGDGSTNGVSNRSSLWSNGFDLQFNVCKPKWRELIADAKDGDLKFCVFCVDVESGLEKKYYFKVSSANLSKLIDLIEQVHGLERGFGYLS